MHLEGTYEFEASQDLVWDMLQNPEVIGSIIPGAAGMKEVDEHKYVSEIVVKVGPVSGRFKADIELADVNPPSSYTLILHSSSPVGHVSGEGLVRLEHADGVTTMLYSGDTSVGGKIASVGQRLLDVAAKTIANQSLNALARKVRDRIEAENQA